MRSSLKLTAMMWIFCLLFPLMIGAFAQDSDPATLVDRLLSEDPNIRYDTRQHLTRDDRLQADCLMQLRVRYPSLASRDKARLLCGMLGFSKRNLSGFRFELLSTIRRSKDADVLLPALLLIKKLDEDADDAIADVIRVSRNKSFPYDLRVVALSVVLEFSDGEQTAGLEDSITDLIDSCDDGNIVQLFRHMCSSNVGRLLSADSSARLAKRIEARRARCAENGTLVAYSLVAELRISKNTKSLVSEARQATKRVSGQERIALLLYLYMGTGNKDYIADACSAAIDGDNLCKLRLLIEVRSYRNLQNISMITATIERLGNDNDRIIAEYASALRKELRSK